MVDNPSFRLYDSDGPVVASSMSTAPDTVPVEHGDVTAKNFLSHHQAHNLREGLLLEEGLRLQTDPP